MIYTIIAFEEKDRKKLYGENSFVLENPKELLPKEIIEYVDNTKNAKTRSERLLAYTSLFAGLKLFFNLDDFGIERGELGKPYLTLGEKEKRKIHISISHSDGVSAVTLSDEGEVGVDLQSEINKAKAERLRGRFMSEVSVVTEKLPINYYFCYVDKERAILEKQFLSQVEGEEQNFTLKWSYSESVMKLYGGGFSDIKKLEMRDEKIRSEVAKITLEKVFYLATSIRQN